MMNFGINPDPSGINGSCHCKDLVSHMYLQLDFRLTNFLHYCQRYDGISEMSFHNFLWHKQFKFYIYLLRITL